MEYRLATYIHVDTHSSAYMCMGGANININIDFIHRASCAVIRLSLLHNCKCAQSY